MATTNKTNVRREIRISNTTVLSDTDIDGFIEDASLQVPVTDELAERYFTCFLIAESCSWDKVKSTGDGVSFEPPSPERFQKKYSHRLRQLGRAIPKKVNWKITDNQEYP